ncbi:MAG: C40 family peptidase [Chitinophagales bacterium]
MKALFISIAFFIVLEACNSARPVSGNATASPKHQQSSIQFIDDISISARPEEGKPVYKSASYTSTNSPVKAVPAVKMENYSDLQFKYAILENASVEEMSNIKLLRFIDEWYGTEYHYGGTNKDGIDCSAFVSLLMTTVYGNGNLPRISRDQYLQSRRVSRHELEEGDLVFFHTQGKQTAVTHVGVYLRNNKFVHASISGVMISDMGVGYYASHYVGGGRVRN